MLDTFRAHLDVLWGFLAAAAIVLVLTPAVGSLARILGVVDEPGREKRRLHRRPVPRLGGLALFLAAIVPALAFLPLDGTYRGILLGAAIATTVGVVDDLRGLPWWAKLSGQFGAAAVAVGFGVALERFTFPFVGVQDLPEWLSWSVSILWIVALMNMVNFVDGMDGLAAGICGIAGATFAVIALSLGKPEAAVLSAIVAGACFGFLRHNFYPARIFMGDSGSMLLGFTLATVSIQGLLKTAATVALFFPLLALAVPIIDTSFVAREAAQARPPGLRGGRLAPAPPLRQHRLLAAPCGRVPVGLVRDPRRRGARDPLRARSAPTASGTSGRPCSSPRSGSSPSPRPSTSCSCSRS